MLTIENLMAALPTEPRYDKETLVRICPKAPGWSACSYFAVRWTEWPDGVASPSLTAEFTGRFVAYVRSWTEQKDAYVDVTEDLSLWMPFIPGTPDQHDGDCDVCRGNGGHMCSCGDEHDCLECDGNGVKNLRRGTAEKLGQSVWRSADGAEIGVQARAAELLRGLRVVRFGPGTVSESHLLGLDEAGEVVVGVMPLNYIEQPEENPPAPPESTP